MYLYIQVLFIKNGLFNSTIITVIDVVVRSRSKISLSTFTMMLFLTRANRLSRLFYINILSSNNKSLNPSFFSAILAEVRFRNQFSLSLVKNETFNPPICTTWAVSKFHRVSSRQCSIKYDSLWRLVCL